MSEKTPRQILKGPCKLLVRSMCAMGHSHIRFIPLVVLIMSTFYLLCKARSTEACNKPTFPIINLQDGIGGFRLIANSPLYHLLFFSYYYSCLLTQFFFHSLILFSFFHFLVSMQPLSHHILVVIFDFTLIPSCELILIK